MTSPLFVAKDTDTMPYVYYQGRIFPVHGFGDEQLKKLVRKDSFPYVWYHGRMLPVHRIVGDDRKENSDKDVKTLPSTA